MVHRPDGWAAYHSLFGNLRLLDEPARAFVQAFLPSATIEDAASGFPHHSLSKLQSLANEFIISGFLVPEGADEYCLVDENMSLRKHFLRTGYLIRTLQLIMSNRCNFRCTYCFMDFQSGNRISTSAASAVGMRFEVAQSAMQSMLELLRRNGNRTLSVEFFGGEPLLNWPVIEQVLRTFGNGRVDDVIIHYSITTNGALITREMAQLLKAYNVTVTVSVDATSSYRPSPLALGTSAQPISWARNAQKVLDSLVILRDCGTLITFNTVLSKDTVFPLGGRRLIDFALRHNARMIGLILDLDLAFYRCPDNREGIIDFLLQSRSYGRQMGIRVGGYWHQIFDQITGNQAINLRSGYKTCPATGCKISVEPDGSIFACKCCSKKMGHIANLTDVICSEEYASYALHAYRNAPKCEGCEIDGFCSGLCMGSLENAYDRRDIIEAGACDILKKVTFRLIEQMSAEELVSLYVN